MTKGVLKLCTVFFKLPYGITCVISRVTENSISTIKFYRVFLKIYER